MARKRTYDQKSYDLAEHFLSDEPALNYPEAVESLAAYIQEQIEDWISGELKVLADYHR